MGDIHPLTPDPPKLHLSRIKLLVSAVILCGVVIFGYLAQSGILPRRSTENTLVLGEDTRTLESYLPQDVADSLASVSAHQSPVRPETLLLTGKEFVASGAARLASAAGSQVEHVASSAAHNITDFIYKNTVERIINTLIDSLPPERQQQYKD